MFVKKIFLAILIFLLVLGLVYFIRLSVPVSSSSNVVSEEPVLISTDPSKISIEVLSEHGSKEDCWVSYDGKVYDVTSFLPRHPGSAEAIIPFCGTSEGFTEAFTNQHGTSKVANLMRVGTLIGDFDIVGEV